MNLIAAAEWLNDYEVKRIYWSKPVFGNSAYFIASCGGVTIEVLKRYVQEQGKSAETER